MCEGEREESERETRWHGMRWRVVGGQASEGGAQEAAAKPMANGLGRGGQIAQIGGGTGKSGVLM
jgi:hypothetical protein